MAPGDCSLDGQAPATTGDPPLLRITLPRPSDLSSSTTTSSLKPPNHSTVAASAAPGPQQSGHPKPPDAGSEMSNNHHRHLSEQGHHGTAAYPPRLPSTTPTYMSYSPYGSPTTQASHDHRPSSGPAASNPMSLPSIRTIDSMAHQSQPCPGPSPGYGTSNLPMAPTVSSMPYYPAHKPPSAVLPSNHHGISPEGLARYALPPDTRMLHRPPKKEIKRRTKTGCLTCRKRRIKCDETHPTCNNCTRSKRHCLGYDPIVRQQIIGGTNLSQPTTTNTARNPPRSSPALPSESPRALPSPSSHLDHKPPLLASGAPGAPELHLSSQPAPPPQRELPTPVSASSPCTKSEFIKSEPGEEGTPTTSTYLDHRQKPLPSISQPDGSLPTRCQASASNHFPEAKKMRVEELINSWGPPPTAPEAIRSEDTYQEVVKVYHEMYAPGLHAFFESTWFYFLENGKMSFPRYEKLVGHMAVFLKVLEGVKVNDHSQMTYSGVLELRLVWELARMAASAAVDNTDNRMRATLPPENDPIEVKHRFRVVEALLGGEVLPWNPLKPPIQDASHHRMREFDFWYQLGEFLCRDHSRPGAAEQNDKAGEDALNRLRWLLDGRENRDVLYSIAVLRHYAHRYDMSQALQAKYHLPEEDPRNKVVVASKFISAQAHVTGGTTNVVRRICDIASRLYVNPGDNARGVVR